MEGNTPPNGVTRSISGIRDAVAPLWQTLSSSFSSKALLRRIDDEPSASETNYEARTPLAIPHTSIFDKNPQIVVGVLLKNVGLGWRPRLFVLQDGVLKYYKVYGPSAVNVTQLLDALRQKGELFTVGAEVSMLENQGARAASWREDQRGASPSRLPAARMEVHMQVGSVKESKTDGRKLYVHSGTMTLTLRAETQDDRWVWAQALRAAKGAWDGLSPVAAGALRRHITPDEVILASEATHHSSRVQEIRNHLATLGVNSEAMTYVTSVLEQYNQQYLQLKATEEAKRHALLEVVYRLENEKRQLETALVVEGQRTRDGSHSGLLTSRSEGDRDGAMSSASGGGEGDQQSTGDGEGGEEAEGEGESESEDEFFECEALSLHSRNSSLTDLAGLDISSSPAPSTQHEILVTPPSQSPSEPPSGRLASTPPSSTAVVPAVKQPEWLVKEGPAPPRRDRLPPPQQREKTISLWSLIKEMVGKDLTRVCLPVYFNEPLSALQKTAEEMEYSELLDAAAALPPHSIDRILRVVAFAVSAYSSTVDRTAKPFNPLLGETYELVHVEKGFRFIAEKVSHHPTIIAAVAEGRGWRLEADADVKSRFWGRSIELKPEGVLKLTFDDGDSYAWNKVTTSINNLILGKIYIDHGGIMRIRSLSPGGLTARVRFKETSMLFDKDPRQVRGYLERDGQRLERPMIHGHWDDALHAELEDGSTVELWRKAPSPPDPTRYHLTSFSIQLNELTPGLHEKVAPTDCRLRPDQAYTEQGMWDEANAEKQRLEHKQRAARRAADAGEPLEPRWFEVLPGASAGKHRDMNELAFAYKGGYWEAREKKDWEGCRDIFGPMHSHQE